MTNALKARFREVDRVATPWDEFSVEIGSTASRGSWTRIAAVGLVAASLAGAAVAAIVLIGGNGAAPTPAAPWLMSDAGMCVERYSTQTLPNRDYAFEGVIAAVDPAADSGGPDPGEAPTTVTFDVERWFWGGSGNQVSLRTYAAPVSKEAADTSIGAHVLASGDEDFLWSCGFTKPFSASAVDEFEAAAAEVES